MPDIWNISSLQSALRYHADRHGVIASNIANANTPGFSPHELLRADQPELSGNLPLARTAGAHLTQGELGAQAGGVIVDDKSAGAGLDGNSVSLEQEMSRLQANDLRYQGAAKLVTRQLAMLRYAANDGSGG